MTSTASAAEYLSAEHQHHERTAAELRHVTRGSRQHGRDHVRVDAVSLEIRRGEVTSLLSRHDRSASSLLDLLDGRASASWGSVLRHEPAARVQPGTASTRSSRSGRTWSITQRRSGRAADLGWIDQVTEALELERHARLSRRAGRPRAPRPVGGRAGVW